MTELNLSMGWPVPPVNNVQPVIDNRFELQSSLGSGALGEVFLALDFSVDPPRKVALKRLHPELLNDAVAVGQLQREAELTCSVNHPNILKVYYYQFRPDIAYIVTELALQPLSKIELPLPLDIVADYLERLASALDHAHAAGLIHRDIKPENVLTGDLGKIMLADFSLAMAIDKTVPHHTMVMTEAWGTPLYAAPEVWEGQICKASDTYALGILIYQMVVGRTPFDGTPDELERLHLDAPITSLAYFRAASNCSRELDEVFRKVLHKDAAQRPTSNMEFYRMFRAALRTRYPTKPEPTRTYPLYPRATPQPVSRVKPNLSKISIATACMLMTAPFMCFFMGMLGTRNLITLGGISALAAFMLFLFVLSVVNAFGNKN